MERITSASNPAIKRLKALRDAKTRQESGLFLVEGEVMIREALACGLTPTEALAEKESALTEALAHAGAVVRLVVRAAIEAACDTKTPQGVCASFSMPRLTRIPANARRLVALDGVQDPGNLGTIWRTADAAGFDALLLGAGCADPWSPKVQRAGMGSGFRVAAVSGEMPLLLSRAQADGFRIVVSALDGAPLYARTRPKPGEKLVLVIGNEAHGVSPEVQQMADVRLKIPMRGGAESLNAAVAAGILMYELTKESE